MDDWLMDAYDERNGDGDIYAGTDNSDPGFYSDEDWRDDPPRYCAKCGNELTHLELDEKCEACDLEPVLMCRECLAIIDQELSANYDHRCLKCHQKYSERLIDQLHRDVLDHEDLMDTLDQAQRLWRD